MPPLHWYKILSPFSSLSSQEEPHQYLLVVSFCLFAFSIHCCRSVLPPPPHTAQPTSAPLQNEVSQTIPHQTMENIRLLLPLLPADSTIGSTEATEAE